MAIDLEEITALEYSLLRVHLTEHWRLIYDIMWYTGLRISEVLALKQGDVVATGILVTRLKGKGSRQDSLPLPATVLDQLRLYALGIKRKTLFPFTRQRAWQVLREAAEKAHIRRTIHPHLFRHSFGGRGGRLDLGLTPLEHLTVLQQMLGHSSSQSTLRYFKPRGEKIKEAWGKIQGQKDSG